MSQSRPGGSKALGTRLILIKNDDAGLQKGDVLEVANVLGDVALLQVVHRPKDAAAAIALPPDILGVSVADGVETKDQMR